MTTPAITELVRDIDQSIGDVDLIEANAKTLVERMGADRQDYFKVQSSAVIARDELRRIASIVEGLETEETRDRQVRDPLCNCSHGPEEHASWCRSQAAA